jgi:Fic family protein
MRKEDYTQPAGEIFEKEDPELGDYNYFVPNIPPTELTYDKEIAILLSEAERSLGMLSGAGEILPNPHILIRPYLAKEAVLSSKIEGTQASLSDVLKFQVQDLKKDNQKDVKEVDNYIKALEYGLEKIKEQNIDFELIKEMHRILLTGVRGNDKEPGLFRTTQNWIGPDGTPISFATYIPPSPEALIKPLHEFIIYVQNNDTPLLIQTALLHHHFEATHPFRDGNGRIGRLLITLFLCKRKALSKPLLYLSVYFERNKSEYYARLLSVSQKSEYLEWIKFFLKGVKLQAEDALNRARNLVILRDEYHQKLVGMHATTNAQKALDLLFQSPYIDIPYLAKELHLEYPTAKRAIDALEAAGIVTEITNQRRNKIYCAQNVLNMLDI